MRLYEALNILAYIHTRPDREIGYMVNSGATPEFSRWSQDEYNEAWGVVRREAGLFSGVKN